MSDLDLVRRARGGDPRAYALLVEALYPRCLRYAVRMLGSRDDAEEAVQDAFVRAHRSLHRYEERDRFDGWVFRILVNRCRTVGARRGRHQRTFVELGDADVGVPPPELPEGWSPEVQRALDALPADLRETLLLKVVEEMSYEEIAEATGSRVSALKMRVKRARDRLREALQEVCHAG